MAQRLKPQATKQRVEQLVTPETSLQTVQTVLDVGLGCIAYLRNLFDDSNFSDDTLVASRAHPEKAASQGKDKKTTQSIKVKKLARGHSAEADKLLDWIEKGAMDALKKSYLRQLALAIYLDPDDPNNVVECYTFDFTYTMDAAGRKHPEMVVRNKLTGLTLADKKGKGKDIESGVPLEEAKRQIQALIKALILHTQSMDELPRRRFVTVRLYYTEDTPDDYEPPLFRPVDASDSAFKLTTGSVNAVPEVVRAGSLATGYHGVTLHVAAVTSLLETAFDDNIPLDEALERNKIDANTRSVVWSLNDLTSSSSSSGASPPAPIGVRDSKGTLHTIAEVEEGSDEEFARLREIVGLEQSSAEGRNHLHGVDKRQESFRGMTDAQALQLAEQQTTSPSEGLESTQVVPVISRLKSVHPLVPALDPATPWAPVLEPALEVSVEKGPEEPVVLADPVVMDVDAQSPLSSLGAESLPQAQIVQQETPDQILPPLPPLPPVKPVLVVRMAKQQQESPGAWAKRTNKVSKACECGDESYDGGMIVCSACEQWKHVVCYGYRSDQDERIPEGDFFCYPCRAMCTANESVLNPEREQEVMETLNKLSGLALFRRAIALITAEGAGTPKLFRSRLAIDGSTANQLIKRLRAENFIIDVKDKAAPKRGRPALNSSPEQIAYQNGRYFSPGAGAEVGLTSLLDLSEDDAEGEVDTPNLQPGSAIAEATKIASLVLAQSVQTEAPLVEQPKSLETPPPLVQPTKMARKARTANEDDPILGSDEETESFEPPRVTPEQAAAAFARPKGQQQQQQQKAQSSPESAATLRDQAFPPSSSVAPPPSGQPQLPNSTSPKRQAPADDDQLEPAQSKRIKCSDAGNVEI